MVVHTGKNCVIIQKLLDPSVKNKERERKGESDILRLLKGNFELRNLVFSPEMCQQSGVLQPQQEQKASELLTELQRNAA